MTVLINSKDMPESCDNCGLCGCYVREDGTEENYRCAVTMYPIRDFDKRHKNCPLVPVPPHGRLIDADALLERFEKEEKAADEHGRDFSFSFKSGGENCTEWWPVQQMLMDAPTIIPAEE